MSRGCEVCAQKNACGPWLNDPQPKGVATVVGVKDRHAWNKVFKLVADPEQTKP